MTIHERNFPGERRFPPRQRLTAKPKAWSHQDALKEAKGKPIRIAFLNGDTLDATLLEADAFTLRVFVAGDHQSALTYFKHGLLGYTEIH